MRKEATTMEWKKLYEVTTRLKEMEPWKYLWDADIVGVLTGDNKEETVFYSILGKGDSCYGIIVYEGYEEFNSFMMLPMQESMNLSVEYAMFNQECLSCYWGNREELSPKQRETIKELGYKYRGKNNWLYFMSYEPGYYPYNLNQDEVIRLTRHLEDFELAFTYYLEENVQIDFAKANMFLFTFSKDRKSWRFGEEPLPFTSYIFANLAITDEKMLSELGKIPRGRAVLEMETTPLGASIADKKYDRPANPMLSVIVEATNGMVLACQMNEPGENPVITLANGLINFMSQYGAPAEIRVSNVIMEAELRQICELCGIKLRRVKRLDAMNEFLESMRGFGGAN